MTLHIKFLAHGQKTSKQTNKKPVAQKGLNNSYA